MVPIARLLILIGVILVLTGLVILLIAKTDFLLGRLPGDVRFEGGNTSCLIALGTSIFLSVLLTLVINLLAKLLIK